MQITESMGRLFDEQGREVVIINVTSGAVIPGVGFLVEGDEIAFRRTGRTRADILDETIGWPK
mgnify:CR=1 FL=1